MGTYGLSKGEIADRLEELEESGKLEGDFTEKVMVDGARLFCDRLRRRGATISKGD